MVSGDTQPVRYGRKLDLSEEERISLAPQTQYRYPERKSRRGLLVAVIVVVLAVTLGYVAYVYLMGSNEASTPEDTFRRMIQAVNEQDWRTAIDFSVDKFASDDVKNTEVATLEQVWAENGNATMTIQSINVIYYDEMPASIASELDSLVTQVESMFGLDVKDSCALQFTSIVVTGGSSEFSDGTIPLVKIGSSWYVASMYESSTVIGP